MFTTWAEYIEAEQVKMLVSVSQHGGQPVGELKRMDVAEFFIMLRFLQERAVK